MATAYIDAAEFAAAIGEDTGLHVAEIQRATLAASRQIDRWTGRFFYRDATPVQRSFLPASQVQVCVGDFDFTNPADITVAVDTIGDGTWVTWDATWWQPRAEPRATGPYVRDNGEPWRYIATTSRTRPLPVSGLTARVRVTARWGWVEIPAEVEQACQVLAAVYYRAPDLAGVDLDPHVGREDATGHADPFSVAMALVAPLAVPGGTLWKPLPGMDRCAA